jgi:hypothetical protein
VRDKLGLKYAPFASPHTAGSLVQVKKVRGVNSSSLYFSDAVPGAPFEMHCEDYWLYSFNYLHRGAPKYWVVVAPHERKHLEKCLWSYLGALWGPKWDRPRCSQVVRHLSVWVSLGALKSWDIDYELVKQQPGELMVTAPEAYHQGWSGGANVAEAINYGDGASARRAATYKPCCASCYHEAKKQKPVILKWPAGDENAVAIVTEAAAASEIGNGQLVDGALPHPDVRLWCSDDIAGLTEGAACQPFFGQFNKLSVRACFRPCSLCAAVN